MERVAFLVESTGETIPCLLNPESVLVRRVAGTRPRHLATGALTGVGLADDPILFTGGGRTELELELFFDVTLARTPMESEDVRELTRPLWNLAENLNYAQHYGRPSLVRFIWGKEWNIPGIIVAVAERLGYFTLAGSPQRSWMHLLLLRISKPVETQPGSLGGSLAPPASSTEELSTRVAPDTLVYHDVVGGGMTTDGAETAGERLDMIANHYYGTPTLWRLLAQFNNLDSPLLLQPGSQLKIPPLSIVGGAQ